MLQSGRVAFGAMEAVATEVRRGPAYSFCTSIGADGAALGAPRPGVEANGGAGPADPAASGAPERISTYETTRLTPGT
jgi:hypothetical protein